jgi:hypothetical protein
MSGLFIRKKALTESLRGAKQYKEEVLTEINHEGKTSTRTINTVGNKGNEPPFIKLFIDDIARMYQLPSETPLLELIRLLNWDNQIILNSAIKRQIISRVGYKSVAVLNNYLSKCVSKGVFRLIDTGIYEANPELFGRGSWPEIKNKRLDEFWLKINYDEMGNKTISSSLANKIIGE